MQRVETSAAAPRLRRPRRMPEKERKEAMNKKDPEETAEHQRLLLQLVRWGESDVFGQYLYSCGFRLTPQALRHDEVEDLKDLLIRVRTTATGMQSKGQLEKMIFTGCRVLEELTQKSERVRKHINLRGWTRCDPCDPRHVSTCRDVVARGRESHTQAIQLRIYTHTHA